MKNIKPVEKEKDIQRAILDLLLMKGIKVWRNNAGSSIVSYKEKTYWMNLAPKGSPDIIGYLNDGRFLGIEVKTSTGIVTTEQTEFLADINKKGGVGFVARSIDDVIIEFGKRKCG